MNKPTNQPWQEYKRECDHGDMVRWKECAECREYLVRKGMESEFTQLLQEERDKENGSEKMKIYSDAYDKAYKIGYNGGYKIGREELKKELREWIKKESSGFPTKFSEKLLTKLND